MTKKLTKQELKKIIKEELEEMMSDVPEGQSWQEVKPNDLLSKLTTFKNDIMTLDVSDEIRDRLGDLEMAIRNDMKMKAMFKPK